MNYICLLDLKYKNSICNCKCWDSNGFNNSEQFTHNTPGQDRKHLASQCFTNLDYTEIWFQLFYARSSLVTTYISNGPVAMLMAGEHRGCFLKAEGGCNTEHSKEVISVFIYAPDQLIKTEKTSYRTNFWSLWKHRHLPSSWLNWTLTLKTTVWMQTEKKWERKLGFLSHGWQRIPGSLFSSVKMITEPLACSDLPWRPEVSVIHSFSSSHLCLWKGELICLGFSFFLFLFSPTLQKLNMNK